MLRSAECVKKAFRDIRYVQADDAIGRGMHVGVAVLPVDPDLRAAHVAGEGDRVVRLFRHLEFSVRAEELPRSLKDFFGRNVCDGYVAHA